MTRAAIYIRVSTEEQARHGLSMDEQEAHLRDYAKEHGMKVVDCYLDAGKSARKRYTKRPEFMRLLADIESDKIDMVLFIKLDRWFRNISDYYEVQRVLDAHNVTWRATQEDYETVTASGRFISHKPQRDAIQRKLSKLSELYISDLISMQDYKRQFRALNDELAAIPEDVPDIDIEALKSRFWGDWRQLYDDLPRDGKQSFWRKTVKKIYLSKDLVADFDLI